jgi:hypothetical protein
MISRRFTALEKFFADVQSTLQCSFEFTNARVATEFVDYALKSCAVFHLRRSGDRVVYDGSTLPVASIAPGIRRAFDASQWAEWANRPPPDRFGSIAVRDNLVTFSAGHSFFDGISFLILADNFRQKRFDSPAPIPEPTETYLAAEIARQYPTERHVTAMRQLSTIPWTSKLARRWPDDSRADAIARSFYPAELTFYNPRRATFDGLSQVLWRTSILTAVALRPDLDISRSPFACTTPINLRPFMGTNTIGLHLTTMTIQATGISPNATISQLDETLRRDFTDKMKRKEYFCAFKASISGIPVPHSNSSYFDVSNVGYVNAVPPFVDCWIQQSMTSKGCTEGLELGTTTLYGNQNARLFVRLPWSPLVFSRSDGIKMYKAITHSLTQLNPRTTIAEAIREIRKVAI